MTDGQLLGRLWWARGEAFARGGRGLAPAVMAAAWAVPVFAMMVLALKLWDPEGAIFDLFRK